VPPSATLPVRVTKQIVEIQSFALTKLSVLLDRLHYERSRSRTINRQAPSLERQAARPPEPTYAAGARPGLSRTYRRRALSYAGNIGKISMRRIQSENDDTQ